MGSVALQHVGSSWSRDRARAEFFRSIGRKRHGETLQMDWSNLIGQRLLVRIAPRSYVGSDGETHVANNVERFLDYNPDAFPQDPDWLAEAMDAGEEEMEIPF